MRPENVLLIYLQYLYIDLQCINVFIVFIGLRHKVRGLAYTACWPKLYINSKPPRHNEQGASKKFCYSLSYTACWPRFHINSKAPRHSEQGDFEPDVILSVTNVRSSIYRMYAKTPHK